jgi:hypothetical protein
MPIVLIVSIQTFFCAIHRDILCIHHHIQFCYLVNYSVIALWRFFAYVSGSPLFEFMKCASRAHGREISSTGHQTATAVKSSQGHYCGRRTVVRPHLSSVACSACLEARIHLRVVQRRAGSTFRRLLCGSLLSGWPVRCCLSSLDFYSATLIDTLSFWVPLRLI